MKHGEKPIPLSQNFVSTHTHTHTHIHTYTTLSIDSVLSRTSLPYLLRPPGTPVGTLHRLAPHDTNDLQERNCFGRGKEG